MKRWKRKRPIGQEVDIIFRPGENLYSKALKRSRWQTHPPNLIFHFSNESLPLLSHIPYLLVPPPQKKNLISTTAQGSHKNKFTQSRKLKQKTKQKRGKIQYPPLPQCNAIVRHVPLALSQTLEQMETHTHPHTRTHFHTKRTSAQRNTRSQSLVEREGDANRGGLWTMAAISTPRPAPALPCPAHPPQTTMNK